MSMSQRFETPCPQCGTQVAVSTDHIGKKGRCPACAAVFPINAPVEALPDLPGASPLRPLPPGLEPLPPGFQQSAIAAPTPSAIPSLFDDVGRARALPQGDLALAEEATSLTARQTTDHARHVFQRLAEKESWQQEKIRQDFNSLMWMGVGLMVLATFWFVGGLFLGIIFFLYPPIMFVVGLFLFFKGLFRFAE
jgi:hypothetical protein